MFGGEPKLAIFVLIASDLCLDMSAIHLKTVDSMPYACYINRTASQAEYC